MNKKLIGIGVILVLVICAMYFGNKESKIEKNAFALLQNTFGQDSEEENTVSIGLAVPKKHAEDNTFLFQGIEMAVDEINKADGILDKELKTVIGDDENGVTKALGLAESFGKDENISAVIGHFSSSCTFPSAQIYSANDTILISPFATSTILTQQGYRSIFRNTLTNEKMGMKLIEYAKHKGYKNIAIYYADSAYGKEVARSVEAKSQELGIRVIDRHSNFLNKDEFYNTYKKWKYMNVDAVVMADIVTSCKTLIDWIREEDMEIPILGVDGFDMDNLIEFLGDSSHNIAFITMLNNNPENHRYFEFVKSFSDKYGHDPDFWAIKGYDSIYLIKNAMESAGTTTNVPEIVKALKTTVDMEGVNGNYSFDNNGNLIEEKSIVKKVENGEYVYFYDE